jgi:formamidopyrimidine-DNA glycosylase
MPELPEVESLRRSLLPFVIGQKIKKVTVLLPKLVSGKGTKREASKTKHREFVLGLEGKTIKQIERRAKNLIFKLSDGGILLVHLKMTGQLAFKGKKNLVVGGHPIQESEAKLPNKHSYITFELSNGNLYYNDVRQFGYVLYFKNQLALDNEKHFEKLGVEPLSEDFTLAYFKKTLPKKSGVIKKVLLDQEIVVGLGNIYADESLFTAKILPTRRASSLKPKEIENLYNAITKIMLRAVELGGSSVANYIMADGKRGTFAREHKVYKRAGKPCLICGNTLQKSVVAARTTVFCKVCQK